MNNYTYIIYIITWDSLVIVRNVIYRNHMVSKCHVSNELKTTISCVRNNNIIINAQYWLRPAERLGKVQIITKHKYAFHLSINFILFT